VTICYPLSSIPPGNTEDKKVPTLVQAFADHKMVGVDCGSGDAHTLFLEDNGEHPKLYASYINSTHSTVYTINGWLIATACIIAAPGQ